MAWKCCCCCSSVVAAAISAVKVPAIYVAAARIPYSFTTTLKKQSVHSQLQSIEKPRIRVVSSGSRARIKSSETDNISSSDDIDCIGTGLGVECVVEDSSENPKQEGEESGATTSGLLQLAVAALELGLVIAPFFFWGTGMVAMKQVLPKTGPFFVAVSRLIPAGFLLIGFAASRGRRWPSGLKAWLSISAFAIIDASCFQGFLAEGLERTTAGLGCVIIDSQPLTVAILASFLFGESLGYIGAAGLVLGVVGLLLLEAPALAFDANNFSLWGSGEWWMFLAAQSMAIGTLMVRWVSKYSDPIMATGWHMVIGGLPLMAILILNHDPALSSFNELTTSDVLALIYSSIFGTAISFGVFFYNATKGSLTKLSSLTFMTPMFASVFGFIYLGETFSPLQLVGALIIVAAIFLVNYKKEVAE